MSESHFARLRFDNPRMRVPGDIAERMKVLLHKLSGKDYRRVGDHAYMFADEDGSLWTLTKSGGEVVHKLKTHYNKTTRYEYVGAFTRTGQRNIPVHQLVCLAFHGAPPKGAQCVRHLDGDRTNNKPSNLAWGTHKENAQDSLLLGIHRCGEASHHAKIDEETVAAIRKFHSLGMPIGLMVPYLRLRHAGVKMIVRGRTWKQVAG